MHFNFAIISYITFIVRNTLTTISLSNNAVHFDHMALNNVQVIFKLGIWINITYRLDVGEVYIGFEHSRLNETHPYVILACLLGFSPSPPPKDLV